ncbi:MAG: 2OG-Fe(II) oxygenase family protein [Acidiferrobacterales bacterium]
MRRRSSELTPGKAWQSNQEIHKLEEFRDFILYVNDTVKTALQFLKIGYDAFEITGCWVNINAPGTSHRIHSHPNNFLSGVYYVQTQTGAGTINFHDPRIQTNIIRPPVTKLTAGNTDQVVVSVRNGTLLVFPSYLQHSVDPNKSDEERISVSFNIMFSSFTENLSKPLW